MHQRFDAYEIRPVHEWDEEDGTTTCESHDTEAQVIESIADCGGRLMWTLYSHCPEGGVEAIADRQTEAECIQLLERITGIAGTPGTLIYALPPTKVRRELDSREIATVLHALRKFQDDYSFDPEDAGLESSEHFHGVTPLTVAEIDALCETINIGDVDVSGVHALTGALKAAYELLVFHEGSAKAEFEGAFPTIRVNSEDWTQAFNTVRAALLLAGEEVNRG